MKDLRDSRRWHERLTCWNDLYSATIWLNKLVSLKQWYAGAGWRWLFRGAKCSQWHHISLKSTMCGYLHHRSRQMLYIVPFLSREQIYHHTTEKEKKKKKKISVTVLLDVYIAWQNKQASKKASPMERKGAGRRKGWKEGAIRRHRQMMGWSNWIRCGQHQDQGTMVDT